VERALYKAESANYQSLALEVEKLRQIAKHIDATTAAIIGETPSIVIKETLPPNYGYVEHTDAPFDFLRGEEKITEEDWRREAPADEVAALDAEPRNAAKAESSNYESLALEVEKLSHTAERIDATTATNIEETPSLVTNEKQPPNYWYVGYTDAPFDFFRGEVRAARDSGRPVVLVDAVIDHQAALDEIARHRCARIGRRMLDVRPVDVLPREGEVGVDRLRRIVRIADDQPANDEHAVTMEDVHGGR